jgi:hypothetical protein
MMVRTFGERQVIIDDVDLGTGAPRFIDAYVLAAHYADNGEDLTEDELNELADTDHTLFMDWYY